MSQRREQVIERVKRRLLRRSKPRLLITLLLLLTGLSGFLVSVSLLRFGMTRMWLRYPLAILIAYCVFLLLLRLWLFLNRPHIPDIPDLSDFDINFSETSSRVQENFMFSGAGGDASGAGAGGDWGISLSSSSSSSSVTVSSGGGTSSGGGGGGGGGFLDSLDLDLGEGCAVVFVIIAIAGAFLASIYVIYIAPALLAEIMVDGILVTGLYKSMKGIEQRHWLRAALRKTLAAALITATMFSVAGWALQSVAPKSLTIGEAWKEMLED